MYKYIYIQNTGTATRPEIMDKHLVINSLDQACQQVLISLPPTRRKEADNADKYTQKTNKRKKLKKKTPPSALPHFGERDNPKFLLITPLFPGTDLKETTVFDSETRKPRRSASAWSIMVCASGPCALVHEGWQSSGEACWKGPLDNAGRHFLAIFGGDALKPNNR